MKRILVGLLLVLAPACAVAGEWQVSYRVSGFIDTDRIGSFSPGPLAWTTGNEASGYTDTLTSRAHGPHAKVSGTVTPILTWVRSDANDGPPETVNVKLTACASASNGRYYTDPDRGPGVSVSSSLLGRVDEFDEDRTADLDAELRSDRHLRELSAQRYICLPVGPTDTVIKLDPIRVAAEANVLSSRGSDFGHLARASVYCGVSAEVMGIETVLSASSSQGAGWPRPPFFSGTSCQVDTMVDGYLQGLHVKRIEIRVNGSVIAHKDYRCTATAGYPSWAALSARFDSSHIKDPQPIRVEVAVTCPEVGATPLRTSYTAASHNKGFFFGNENFVSAPSCAVAASEVFDKIGYPMCPNPADKSLIVSQLKSYNVFYASTHAGPGFFGDSHDTEAPRTDLTPHQVWFSDLDGIEAATDGGVMAKHERGTRTAPYVLPPYSFVWIDGCESLAATGQPDSTDLAVGFELTRAEHSVSGLSDEDT